MAGSAPRWRRRKTARPGEIIAAALEVFAEKGFGSAKVEDIARAAGVSKGAIYLYFETKEDIFRAVARAAVKPTLAPIAAAAEHFEGAFADLLPVILGRAAQMAQASRLPAVVRMVIGESRNFPDLARIWHDDVVAPVIGLLAAFIRRAQARGEVAPGDPRLFAFSLAGPMVMGVLFREVFGEAGADRPDLPALAAQHARVLARGMLAARPGA